MIKLNGHPINVTMFPDKTSQVWKLSYELIASVQECKEYVITWNFEHEGEIFHIIQLLYTLSSLCKDYKFIILDCPYLPYARQDKDFSNESCFALTVFCSVFGFIDELRTFDVHNPSFFEDEKIKKETRMTFKFVNTLPYDIVNKIIKDEGINLIVYPDKGASTRYPQLSENYPYVSADKVRDQLTGEIVGISVPEIDCGLNILVVDDLCDGGRTFVELAKVLAPFKPANLILYVSHGIFSKGTGCLFNAGYSEIYTKNGMVNTVTWE